MSEENSQKDEDFEIIGNEDEEGVPETFPADETQIRVCIFLQDFHILAITEKGTSSMNIADISLLTMIPQINSVLGAGSIRVYNNIKGNFIKRWYPKDVKQNFIDVKNRILEKGRILIYEGAMNNEWGQRR